MVKSFKFFHGFEKKTQVMWMPETDGREYYDITEQLTRHLSNNIAEEIDNNIVSTLIRSITGGGNHGIDYLNHWLRIGDNRA
jgi:hypothetical protein